MIKVGDIYVATWGYDQTNATFFQIVKVREKTISVRKIRSNEKVDGQTMVGYSTPIRDAFDGGIQTKRIIVYDGQECFRAGESFGLARPWNGEPVAISTYA